MTTLAVGTLQQEITDRAQDPTPARLSGDGLFPNGVSAAAVAQLVLDYDETARLEDVAGRFGLECEDVAAALRFYAAHRERLHASGEVVPPR